MKRHGFLVTYAVLSLGLVLGCVANGGEGSTAPGAVGPEDCEPTYVLTPELEPGQAGITEDVTIDIFISPNSRCYREGCESTGDCNTQCIKVEPTHAQIFYHEGYRPGVPPGEGGYTPGLPRQARWHVQCVSNQSCLENDSSEECVASRKCLQENMSIRIKPAHKTPRQKSAAFKKAGFGKEMVAAAKVCGKKRPPAYLFGQKRNSGFEIKAPNNIVYSGIPVDPNFEENGCPGASEDQGRMLEWYYDVELLREGEVIMRLDPELWIEEDD